MKIPCCLFLFSIALASCAPITSAPTEIPLPSLTPTLQIIPLVEEATTVPAFTSLPPTFTLTPIPPTATTQSLESPTLIPTETSTPTLENTQPPTSEIPGVQVSGTVTLPNGDPIANAQIYFAISAGPYSTLLATTNTQGQYEGFIGIPHQEIVRVWAEMPGYTFKPGNANRAWAGGEFGWQYYGGFESVNLSFIGTPN